MTFQVPRVLDLDPLSAFNRSPYFLVFPLHHFRFCMDILRLINHPYPGIIPLNYSLKSLLLFRLLFPRDQLMPPSLNSVPLGSQFPPLTYKIIILPMFNAVRSSNSLTNISDSSSYFSVNTGLLPQISLPPSHCLHFLSSLAKSNLFKT